MYRLLFFIIFGLNLLLLACKPVNTPSNVIETIIEKELKYSWLQGKWIYTDENGFLIEEWQMKNDSTFLGNSYFISENDTLFKEFLQLSMVDDSIFYENIENNVSTINNKVFKGKYFSPTKIVLENPLLSFPRTIQYNLLNDTLMMIEIAGKVNGFEETQPYKMIKITQ